MKRRVSYPIEVADKSMARAVDHPVNVPTDHPLDPAKFRNALQDRLGDDNADRFIETMQNYGAIVAGGSVTGVYCNYPINDFDVYVPDKYGNQFVKNLLTLGFKLGSIILQPVYDRSFLRKNGIAYRIGMNSMAPGYCRFDIMITTRPVLSVASNFDLTCCQMWFDGTNVGGTHIKDTLDKVSYLNEDYFKCFLNGNRFTLGRIMKYRDRGFCIKFPVESDFTIYPSSSQGDDIVTKMDKFPDCISDPEEWAVKKIYKQYLDNVRFDFKINRLLIGYNTLDNLIGTIGEKAVRVAAGDMIKFMVEKKSAVAVEMFRKQLAKYHLEPCESTSADDWVAIKERVDGNADDVCE